MDKRRFQINRKDACVMVEVGDSWADVTLVHGEGERSSTESALAGLVSPSFRKTTFAPYLLLTARSDDKPCLFRTTFLACEVR
jgi:hypothetical protein